MKKNARTSSNLKSNHLRNINIVRWESRNITTTPAERKYRKPKVIAFDINASVDITANKFDVSIQE